ncbi:MAG TPA: thiamine pyrophosphate-dependent enzyme [Candidatus Babeliales bacterium]|nr:thiamine pyrophosphate-dependent enzyme [Candidatus Babeliales bacterium]
MPALSKDDKLRLLRIILESRHADLREQNLIRQGKGHFHVSGMGHEALAAVSIQMEPDDYIVSYYRDRGLVLGRGMTTRQLGLEYFAKRNTGSGGRQMPSHYSDADLHIWSVPTPTGSQLLPACGIAWGIKLDGKKNVVVTTIGDAATRQGDFFEAICFAKEKKLPVLFLVEDNAYGISMPTRKTNPLALDILAQDNWREIEGQDVQQVYDATAEAFEKIRRGDGPFFFWVKMERLSSHTSSDDHKLYRAAEELENLEKCDPLTCWKDRLIEEGVITQKDYADLDNEIKERVRREYAEAEKAEDPSPNELLANVTKPPPKVEKEILPPGKYRIGDTVNKTLRAGIEDDSQRILFGEDVEDPKGGVFRLTQKLSSEFPKQVFNSPLAESTILGVACGLAAYGKRPVFEMQFIDFIYPGFNQLVTNISTIRWRSFGNWKCPAVIYAPYGAYLPGGSLWHSQANESALAHYPGLNVVIPSTPADAAGLLWSAMHAEDPVIFLVPKHLLWAEHEYSKPIRAVPLGKARNVHEGSDVTLVAWGNTIEKSLEALNKIGNEISVELIDLRSIVPWDAAAIEESVGKTRRLVVVQEDTENCSVGQMIISHVTGNAGLWNELLSPPVLVSKPNVVIGYNPIYEYAALPDVERIVTAIRRSVASKQERTPVAAGVDRGRSASEAPVEKPGPSAFAKATADRATPATKAGEQHAQSITVPIMGEGIRSAKIVSLLKKPGEKIQLDDELCEVETDKAVYPIQSSFAGVMGEWKTKIGDTVDIGQDLGTILTSEPAVAAGVDRGHLETEAAVKRPGSSPPATAIEPALSATITRKLNRVIPANLQIDVRWEAIRNARQAVKKTDREQAPSPSVMIAWSVVRAMEMHPPFRRLILEDDQIVQNDNFDLGIAVALDGDRLATAVITTANQKNWTEFVSAFNDTVSATRGGRVDAMNAPVVITSLGAFEVKAGAPIVVPPSVGTLFVGTSHRVLISNKTKNETAEVITLSLTFDHRVVNGAGAAAFANEIKKQIEKFEIPSAKMSAASAEKR